MFSELNKQFRNSKKFYFNDDVIVINPWSDRLKLLLSAILIPTFCSYFYYLQFGCKYVQFGVVQNYTENISPLMTDDAFDVGKTYILYEKASEKTFAAKVIEMNEELKLVSRIGE